MADERIILELDGVARRYESVGGGDGRIVLRDVSLRVLAGEAVSIVGSSGSGKSTLLNLIGALDRPTAGTVLMEGRDLGQCSDAELAAIRASQIGLVFQQHHLLPQCTVWENVLVPTLARPGGADGEQAQALADRLLERVGLAGHKDHRPGQLSGGERQRVAVVRALINGPKLLLADEPTGALDRAAADNLAALLIELNREEGVTLIVVTHSLPLAHRIGRVMELRDGVLAPETPGQ